LTRDKPHLFYTVYVIACLVGFALSRSVAKTRHLLVGHEAVKDYGWGAEFVAKTVEAAWDKLDAAPRRVGGARTPIPYSEPLEAAVVPQVQDIVSAVREVLNPGTLAALEEVSAHAPAGR
jgi:pyruvate/2-oxoglutarate/acetoin dehydrogenase E1 component